MKKKINLKTTKMTCKINVDLTLLKNIKYIININYIK